MAKKKTEQNAEEAVNEPVEQTEAEAAQPTELEKATALADDYKRKWYAVSAEYDNYRKRNAAAVSKAYADGAAEAILKLLPVADNFGYALSSASDEKTRSGIDKVIKSFLNILSSLGVMEAVLNFPCGEGEAPNTVKQVLKKGYKTKDGKVIRYAQVAVTVEQ